MIGLNLVQRNVYLLPRKNFSKTFKIKISSREEMAADSVLRNNAISLFTDWSKTETGISSGRFSENMDFSESFSLPLVFLSGVLRNKFACKENCTIFSFFLNDLPKYRTILKVFSSNLLKTFTQWTVLPTKHDFSDKQKIHFYYSKTLLSHFSNRKCLEGNSIEM